jgi:predicted SprT family Zn-dependent metalloprotease
MDLKAAQKLATELMQKYGLFERGWNFRFNGNARRAGVCKFGLNRIPKRIELSHHWARLHSDSEVKDTILHEIAHALVGPEAGHGPKWKREAIRIGAKPRRVFKDERLAKTPAYTIFCENNCSVTVHRYKLGRRWRYSLCGKCGGPLIIFDHRGREHFRFVLSSLLTSRRIVSKMEIVPRLGRTLRNEVP